jgi:hypothetical protein
MEQESATEAEETEFIVEETSRSEYIASSYNSILAVADFDTEMMSKKDAQRIKRIKRKALRIIDECISEMYDEMFEDEEEED